jgi:GMP synthase (glutamine-hydrolysing)
VAGIQALMDSGRIIEPLTAFYKDEVREIGRELGVPEKFLARHPFPGPGLAIRCLCSETSAKAEVSEDGVLLPVRSVGVQGDERSYRKAIALLRKPTRHDIEKTAPGLTNARADINRVVAVCGSKSSVEEFSSFTSFITRQRLTLLREADAVVRRFSLQSGFEDKVWQFPVVLIPVGTEAATESIVLRPIYSVDGMTADVVLMDPAQLEALTSQLLALSAVAAVFYDLTNKPPGTIEWE